MGTGGNNPGSGGSGASGATGPSAGGGAGVANPGTGGTDPTAGSSTGATGGTSAGAGGSSASSPFINSSGKMPAGNAFGLEGYWYAFADGVTSAQSGNPYRDGMYCVTGTAPGDGVSDHWGAGVGVDLNLVGGVKMPYAYEGRITGFRMRLVGTAPAPVRVGFVTREDSSGVPPFIIGTFDESVVYNIAEAQVPLDWGVENAGERVAESLYALQILAPGSDAAGPIDLCVAEFEPIYDPGSIMQPTTGPYINSDGFMRLEDNTFGIQGPVYAISDGVSSTQSGNPIRDGKYCISGTFSGAEADWGAGIAFDLNRPPGGGAKAAYDPTGKIGGFRIGLEGSSPGPVRVQFILDEPQAGNQPLLVGRLGATTDYRIAWAQVPTSWDVDDAGREVGTSIYTVQVYLDGSLAGPFDVCVNEFLPLTDAELVRDAQPAAAGYTGARTIDDAMLAAEYELWKSRHFQDCGDGTACVPRDEGDCISEGVAYGMLLAVGNDDQASFDKLWAYFEKHKNPNGVMRWQTAACGAAMADGSATDGELDAAMALIQASCRWGGTYGADATELIAAIKNTELASCNGDTILKPGDNFGGCDRTNPSYVAPGYFKVFATYTNDTSWNAVADSGYELLAALQASKNGLVSDWSDGSGVAATGDEGEYGPDASRTPWRVATDYAWFNETRAITFLNNAATYVDENGGLARTFEPNSAYRGGLAMSALPAASAKAQEYTDAWLTTSVDDDTYFPGTLRPLYMLLMAHRFPNGCN
jgi:endo-1,4-beta-D-glucanase Y